ncbi:MAG: sensor domain-containing protein [Chloroflexota bacterium]
MINSIEEYLTILKKELKGSDQSTIQDALSDAEEHLRTALDSAAINKPEILEADALQPIIEEYGAPDEISIAYKELERLIQPTLAASRQSNTRNFLARFFGIYAEPKAWGALLYMIISLLTGIIFFTWTVIGISFSISFALFIFGLPLIAFFLLSIRGLALVEGRIIEALLGVRMPRRPLFYSKNLPWRERLKMLVTDKHTWLASTYMLLMLPLGTLYFTLFTILISFSVALIATPIAELIFDLPLMYIYDVAYRIPPELMPLVMLAGVLLITATMHLAKIIGKLHGSLAKTMLVAE